MAEPHAEDLAKERVRALLSSYYGTAPAAPQAGGQAPSSGAGGQAASLAKMSNAMPAIDSPAFNADQHISKVLRTYPLEKLMIEHRSMAREIKNLDSDMQQLVYENYNKFIAATDTIRVMKGSIAGMSSDMDRLKTITDNVADKSISVSAKLQQRRESMEELHKVQQLLKKLQVVFDLPKKMKTALEEDALNTAVSFYAEAQPLLKKYGHKGTFKAIAVESDAVAHEISQLLKRRLTERKDDPEQSVLLLRKLGESDNTLQDKYLHGRVQRIKKILAEASAVAEAMSASALDGQPNTPPKSRVEAPEAWGFTKDAAPSLRSFVKVLDEKFIGSVQETVLNVIRFFLPDHSEDQSGLRKKPLLALTKDLFAEYFVIVRRVLSDAITASVHKGAALQHVSEVGEFSTQSSTLDFTNDWGAESMTQALSTLSADVGLLHSSLPELSLKARALELVQEAVQQHVDLCFSALRQRVMGAVLVTRGALGDSITAGASDANPGQLLRKSYNYTTELLQRGLASVLQGLKPYESSRLLSSWKDTFVDQVHCGLQATFLQLLASFLQLMQINYDGSDLLREALKGSTGQAQGSFVSEASTSASQGSGPSPEAPKSGLVLLLGKVCTHMEQQLVPWVMETIASAYVGGGRGSDQPPSFVPGEVARRLSAASSALLAAYVEIHGRQLSLMVRRSVASTHWLHHREPRGPRPVCDLIMERLGRVDAEVAQLMDDARVARPDERDASGTKASGYADPAAALEAGNVERNVAKLFREKVQIFGGVTMSAPHILSAVCGVGLKSLVECIRLQTLGRSGLQQLQLDVQYMRPGLRRFTRGGRGATVVESLLDEVVAAGAERCLEPQLLEAAVIDRILSSLQ